MRNFSYFGVPGGSLTGWDGMERFCMYRRLLDPKISVCIVYVSAMFMSIMDSTVVNVALPALSTQFNVPSTSIEGVIVGYLVSLAIIIPVSGWLGDRWGTRRIFLGALAIFTVVSALCGLAPSLPALIGLRVLQGFAGGALTPVGLTMLYRAFPPEERVSVSRILNIPTVIAPASGPVIGGFLIEHFSWRWVFYINVPIGAAALLFGLLFLREPGKKQTVGRFDPYGFVLAGFGLALLMYALTEGPTYGWSSLNILITGVIGLGLLIAFVVVELRTHEPMIELRLLKDRLFRTTNLVTVAATSGFMGLLFVAPLFLQEARDVSPLISGLTTFPEAVGVIVATQIVAWLYPRVGPRRVVACGLTFVTVVMAVLCLMDLNTNLWWMRLLMFLTGAGMASTFISTPAAAFATISPANTGKASALYSADRQLGSALGIAVTGTVLSVVGPVLVGAHGSVQPNLAAYHATFLTSAALVLLAAGIALFIHDSDAAATMILRRKKATGEQAEATEIAERMEEVIIVE
jgi:EmrB/QacA subfamily drug resistance transporter